jgi:mono/diheme cytochrome c family protein
MAGFSLTGFGIALAAMSLSACAHVRETPDVAAGRRLAERHCAACHAVEGPGPSPLADAPAFRDLPARFPVRRFTRAYRGGLFEGHPRMPPVELGPDELKELAAFLSHTRP